MPVGRDLPAESQSQFCHKAFEFHVDVAKQLVRVKFGERVTSDEISSYVNALQLHPDFQSGFAEIVDLREAGELDLQAAEFIRLADQVDPFSREAKRAFVVRTSAQDHAARLHKILRAQRNIAIFRSLEETEDWISS